MNTRVLFSLVSALWITLLANGCSVDNCKEGTAGCIGGAPVDGECKFDLKPVGGKCVSPSQAGSGGNNGDDGGTSGEGGTSMDKCGGCGDGELCNAKTKKCVNFCEVPDVIPGTGDVFPQIPCTGDVKDVSTGEVYNLTFEESCKSRCQLDCRWQEWFCGTKCAPGYCDDAARITECKADCNSGNTATDLTCINNACKASHERGCTGGMCPGGAAPSCAGVTCSNDCANNAENLFDGFCDDGAYSNSLTNFCPFGSDCADCGPRKSAATADDTRMLALGEPCPNNWRCGHTGNYMFNTAWCIPVAGLEDTGLARCVQDCSTEDRPCTEGFECRALKVAPDRNGIKPKACVPVEEKQCQ